MNRKQTKILVTGSSGFVGTRLVKTLNTFRDEYATYSVVRKKNTTAVCNEVVIESIDRETDWSILQGYDVVIHCAGLAHAKVDDNQTSASIQYLNVNVHGSCNLARQAAIAGVQRFIFVSSIGVNGICNTTPFTEFDTPNPVGLYAQSKWNAEKALWDVQNETGMDVVIIRPPLIYGPGAPGNFGSLLRFVSMGLPLPFGAIYNQRSLVALDNLVDLVITCINHPAAANEVFLAGDVQYLSTTELLQGVANAMGKPLWLIPVPEYFLVLCCKVLGTHELAQRLLNSLQVDISKARNLLGWEPPITVEEGLRRCFQSQDKK